MKHPQKKYLSEVHHEICVTYTQRVEPFNMTAFHYHNVYELYLFLSGERLLFYRDRTYPICAGDIVFIPKNELHCFTDDELPGYSMILVDFQESFFRDILESEKEACLSCFHKDMVVISPDRTMKKELQEQFYRILEEYRGNNQNRSIMLRLLLEQLLLRLLIVQEVCQQKPEEIVKKQSAIPKVMKYIHDNYEKKISLDDLAKESKYSKNYLCCFFKKYTGMTIVEYLQHVRVQKAQELLCSSEKTVLEISILCGFESLTDFGRVFRKVAGMSALQYRKNVLLL